MFHTRGHHRKVTDTALVENVGGKSQKTEMKIGTESEEFKLSLEGRDQKEKV